MPCIDIFSPGRLLTVPILVEQVWLRASGKKLLATEIYDFLLQVDDDKPLDNFFVGSPHFCRKRQEDNTWKDNVYLLPVGEKDTKWGWFYYGKSVKSRDGRLSLFIPDVTNPTSHPQIEEFEGYDLVEDEKEISWYSRLNKPVYIDIMKKIRKSLYQIKINKPLQPYGKNKFWFRILIEPVLFDTLKPMGGISQTFLDWIMPIWNLHNYIACPIQVRTKIIRRIEELKENPKETRIKHKIEEVGQIVTREGFHAPGTSTRIGDHRLIFGGHRVKVDIQGLQSVSIAYIGTQCLELELPPFGHDYNKEQIPSGKKIEIIAHSIMGGSVRNSKHDLVGITSFCIDQVSYGLPKSKTDLARSIAPSDFPEGCILIEKMKDVGILDIVGDQEICKLKDGMTNDEFYFKMGELRRKYLNPDEFKKNNNKYARTVFLDLHSFRVDFICSWATPWRGFLLFIIALIALAISIFSIILK
ncbi:MAG: hypothetical protein AB1546_10370 [bacterium]